MTSGARWKNLALIVAVILLVACTKSSTDENSGKLSLPCAPGAFSCEDGGVICSPNGDRWLASPCAANELCLPASCDDCEDECRVKQCEPGELVCSDDRAFVYRCDETGTSLCYSHSCQSATTDGVCGGGECLAVCQAEQKSYLGCEYYAVDLDNANVPCGRDELGNIRYCDAANSQFAVVLSNPDPTVTVYGMVMDSPVDVPATAPECGVFPEQDGYIKGFTIPPRGIVILELPARNVEGTTVSTLAYRVVANSPLTAYQFNPLENVEVFSNDASLLLPTSTAGTDYWMMTREQTFDDLKGFVTVVGISPEPVEVTVTVSTKTLPGESIPGLRAGDSYTTRLSAYEVLNIETNQIGADLTGSRVQADGPVLVFGGSEASNAPNTNRCNLETRRCEFDESIECGCDEGELDCSPHAACTTSALITCCADHLEQQLFPVETWGQRYLAVRSMQRGAEEELWRVLARDDATSVVFTPAVHPPVTLNAGAWIEIETNADFLVESTKPVMVGQFLAAEQAPRPGRDPDDANTGDPAFMLAVPIEQFRDNYVFLAPDKYEEDYVSIAFRTGEDARLDGTRLAEVTGGDVVGTEVAPGWSVGRFPIADGLHTLTCPGTCSVMVHGYDQYVSYGYPGGLDLKDIVGKRGDL